MYFTFYITFWGISLFGIHFIFTLLGIQIRGKKGDYVHRASCKNCQTWRWISVRFSPSLTSIQKFIYSKINKNENGKTIEFFVILCGDVLFEVLCWGDRRRLTKLERIGRRFHWTVVKFFSEIPFLRLNFELKIWYLFAEI